MQLRVTRPGFIQGIQRAREPPTRRCRSCRRSSAGAPAARPSPTTRTPMRRAPRCARSSAGSATSSTTARRRCRSPSRGARGCARADRDVLGRDQVPDGERFFDYKHAETGAPILKAQHPEFELWSQGIHARSGVACADCHMPYMRDGATKVSDHWVRSPLLNVNRACQTCHRCPRRRSRRAST